MINSFIEIQLLITLIAVAAAFATYFIEPESN